MPAAGCPMSQTQRFQGDAIARRSQIVGLLTVAALIRRGPRPGENAVAPPLIASAGAVAGVGYGGAVRHPGGHVGVVDGLERQCRWAVRALPGCAGQ